MKNLFKGKKILITGASGSIGSSIVKNILKNNNFNVIRAMSNDENGLHELLEDIDINIKSFNLNDRMKRNKFRILYGDIRDYNRCLSATKEIDIVIHAAALKHVSICEYNPEEAYKTNVNGTKNLIRASIKNKVKKFLFISTDKAADPSNDMGTTKHLGEQIALKSNKKLKSSTKISCVRFGNVLGSRGSVIPRFVNQIKYKRIINLTSKDMTRFIMTINDAVRLIFKSIQIMKGKEIFIFKSMFAIKILDLAYVIKKYYEKEYKKILIKEIGITSKEKTSEVLMTQSEFYSAKETRDMYIIKNNNIKNKKINLIKINKINSHKVKLLSKKQIFLLLKKNKILN